MIRLKEESMYGLPPKSPQPPPPLKSGCYREVAIVVSWLLVEVQQCFEFMCAQVNKHAPKIVQ